MHIITRKLLDGFSSRHPDANNALAGWYKAAKLARWHNLVDVRRVFPHADLADVESGNKVTVFNVCGNKYRLVAAIHYNRGKVFILRIMTHEEYSRNHWKDTL